MSGRLPPWALVAMLGLRDRVNWLLIVVEARWTAAPPPLRALLRGLARLPLLRRWIRIA